MAASDPILIAGGGIGGLALALALARKGRAAIVLERRSEFAPAGAGIQLGPNGVRVLQRLGIAEALRPSVGEPEAIRVHEGATGRVLAQLPLGAWIAARHGAPYWVAHRGDLHAALLEAASSAPDIAIRMGFDLASVAQTGQGILATSSAGDSVTAPALVGADGLWSRTRDFVCPAPRPWFVGETATRTVISAADAGPLASPVVGLWLGSSAHVVHYPVRGGAEVAVVVIAAEDWAGTDWEAEADRDRLIARLSHFDAGLRDVLMRAPTWRKWALHRLPALPRWSAGRITLIGDAAHPMLPYLAQGGVLALEDALLLGECLALHGAEEPRAFHDYERLRRRRATRVQSLSRRNGQIYHLVPPFSWMRDGVLRLVPGRWLMRSYDWLYGWRAETAAAHM